MAVQDAQFVETHQSRDPDVLARTGQALVAFLTTFSLFLMLSISAMALGNWGLTYEAPGGAFWEKLHPASWLVFLTFLLAMAGSGNPVRYLDGIVATRPGLFVFFMTFLLALFQLVVIQKVGFTPVLETFLMPMVFSGLILTLHQNTKYHMAMLLHGMFALNACLGLYEYLTGFRLTPYVAGTLLIEGDWRSTALFGHPLANASLTASYVIALCVGGGRELPGAVRVAALVLMLLAMVAFGGRSSLIIVLVFVGVAGLRQVSSTLAAPRISLAYAAFAAILIPVLAGSVVLVAQSGFFDRLSERFADDSGSANERILLLQLFEHISWPDLLLGPDPGRLAVLQQQIGIAYGLESFWLATILGFGLIVAAIFFVGLFCFCRDLVQRALPGAYQVLLFYFINASTSVSLSAKTHTFGIIIAILLVLLRCNGSRVTLRPAQS